MKLNDNMVIPFYQKRHKLPENSFVTLPHSWRQAIGIKDCKSLGFFIEEQPKRIILSEQADAPYRLNVSSHRRLYITKEVLFFLGIQKKGVVLMSLNQNDKTITITKGD